jgi:hypothetical protein
MLTLMKPHWNILLPVPITLIFILFMPNHLSFGCVFPSFWLFLGLLNPDPDSECGSGSRRPADPDPLPNPKHWPVPQFYDTCQEPLLLFRNLSHYFHSKIEFTNSGNILDTAFRKLGLGSFLHTGSWWIIVCSSGFRLQNGAPNPIIQRQPRKYRCRYSTGTVPYCFSRPAQPIHAYD